MKNIHCVFGSTYKDLKRLSGDDYITHPLHVANILIDLNVDETNNKIYMDNGEQRLQYGGDVSLISSVDYATANNAFNALATTQLFLNKKFKKIV